MIREHHTITIDRSVAEVFSYITNVASFAEWSSAVQKATLLSDPPLREGTTILETVKLLGRRIDTEMEVTELKTDRVFARRSLSGPVVMHIKAELQPEGTKSRVRWTIEADAPGFFRLASPVLRVLVKRQLKTTSARLKDRLNRRV
jgi:carbon monoxide dehydrogenase subunit G